jgi:hypothetical protein
MDTVEGGLRGRTRQPDSLSSKLADIDKNPVVRGKLCQLHGDLPFLNPIDLDLKHVHLTRTCYRNIQIVFRDVKGSALREERGRGKEQNVCENSTRKMESKSLRCASEKSGPLAFALKITRINESLKGMKSSRLGVPKQPTSTMADEHAQW